MGAREQKISTNNLNPNSIKTLGRRYYYRLLASDLISHAMISFFESTVLLLLLLPTIRCFSASKNPNKIVLWNSGV